MWPGVTVLLLAGSAGSARLGQAGQYQDKAAQYLAKYGYMGIQQSSGQSASLQRLDTAITKGPHI